MLHPHRFVTHGVLVTLLQLMSLTTHSGAGALLSGTVTGTHTFDSLSSTQTPQDQALVDRDRVTTFIHISDEIGPS